MKHISLIFLTFFSLLAVSQNKNAIHVGITEGVYLQESIFRNLDAYSKTDVQIGMQFELESSTLNAYGIYQLFGNVNSKEFSNYLFASHLLGVGVEQRISKTKRVSLFIGANLLTEIASNFENGYMRGAYPSYPTLGEVNNFYHSTPFANSVYLGADVKIYKSLHLNISIENNFRILKMRSTTLAIEDFDGRTLDEVINDQELKTVVVDRLGLRIGLNYNFSYKNER
ncbi:hypothetical protein ERX46_07905 [Brumimicrobium glaciale]|uniref:Outer membrane protein beta-barrel domain-containing protein n=1 Tax=Brumimicrobium glaciale TaxID=200475 RepID=A0A4Q4KLG4_9FLAO|nr:hypothetical protein [Brumimicrobium glaciale]RYM33878.1 hypothetical protein ERX46_07905 [Brumimicrobium glaciale]